MKTKSRSIPMSRWCSNLTASAPTGISWATIRCSISKICWNTAATSSSYYYSDGSTAYDYDDAGNKQVQTPQEIMQVFPQPLFISYQ